jgi:F-type H+-transporting ATPase subunit b
MRVLILSAALLLAGAPALAHAEDHEEGAAEHHEAHGGHGSLSLQQVLTGELPEGASEEQIAEAKHETLSFWGSVVNFSLLVGLIVFFARKPVSAQLQARRDELSRGMTEAAEAKAKAEAVFNEYNERMKTLDAELAKLKSDMANAAAQDKAKIVAEAEESSKRLRAETEALIARQGEQLEAQIRREVVEAAMAAAERAVREKTTSEDQRRLAEAFVRELGTKATDQSAKQPAALRTEKRA